jgi:hypothetical protein
MVKPLLGKDRVPRSIDAPLRDDPNHRPPPRVNRIKAAKPQRRRLPPSMGVGKILSAAPVTADAVSLSVGWNHSKPLMLKKVDL